MRRPSPLLLAVAACALFATTTPPATDRRLAAAAMPGAASAAAPLLHSRATATRYAPAEVPPPAQPADAPETATSVPDGGDADDDTWVDDRHMDYWWAPGSGFSPPVADGVRGWHTANATDWFACEPVPALAATPQPPAGLSFAVEVRRPIAEEVVSARVYVTNRTGDDVELPVMTTFGTLVDASGHPVADLFRTSWDARVEPPGPHQVLAAYEYTFFDVEASAVSCGDTWAEDLRLPDGEYGFVGVVGWTAPDGGGRGEWVSAPAPVTIDYWGSRDSYLPWEPTDHRLVAAPDAPCRTDGTACGHPADVPPSCSTAVPPSGDYGAAAHLTLSYTPNPEDSGSGLGGEFTVTNDGSDVAWLHTRDRWDVGTLSGAGGRFESGRREYYIAEHHFRIEPGASVRIGGQVSTSTCGPTYEAPGLPLPPGVYTLVARLYVDGYGWWPAPARTVVLR